MKVDNAIKMFTEKYDQEAIRYVDRLSNEFGLKVNKCTMPAVNLQESFDQFIGYLEGYGKYKVKHLDDPKASPQEKIRETTTRFCESLFTPADLRYSNVVEFVTGYLNGCQRILNIVETVKNDMMDAGVADEDVGDVNNFVDEFMEKADAAFYPIMDKIVRASGYTTEKALAKNAPKTQAPVFL